MQQIRSNRLMNLVVMLVLLVTVACGGEGPLTVRELEETREAAIATAEAEATAEADGRVTAMQNRAPEGTVFSEVEPDRGHDSSISIPFGTKPPMGGVHHPSWQRCQVYDDPIKVEHAVHALEHGGVWITYQPDIDADAIDRLGDYTRREPFVMVSPYPGLESPVIVTAWGLQLSVDSADDARIEEFIDAFANGPQTPEPGASCATGVQDTVDS